MALHPQSGTGPRHPHHLYRRDDAGTVVEQPLAASVSVIPAGIDPAEALVSGLCRIATDPMDMAAGIVLLPSRRAVGAIKTAFLRHDDGQSRLLPRLVPLGDMDEDASELIQAGWQTAGMPPRIEPLQRQLILMRLVGAFRHDSGARNTAETAALAAALASLLDQVQTAGLSLQALQHLVADDYADHWQKVLQFLEIISSKWPAILDDLALSDPAAWRDAALRARADAWQSRPPGGFVVIAGSTGSVPATRRLMQVVAGLPRGHLVLPGLDLAMADADWQALLEETTDKHAAARQHHLLSAGHPQYALARLLEALGLQRHQLAHWPDCLMNSAPDAVLSPPASQASSAAYSPRQGLIAEIMRPAAQTARWRKIPESRIISQRSTDGIMLAECHDRHQEAMVIALAMRQALEVPQRRAMLVTADRQLALMVCQQLNRWQISIDDSAGTPLRQTLPARLVLLLAEAWASGFTATSLLALLHHPFCCVGMTRKDFRCKLRALEIEVLRRPPEILSPSEDPTPPQDQVLPGSIASGKTTTGLDGIALAATAVSASLGRFVSDQIIPGLMPLLQLGETASIGVLANATGEAAENLVNGQTAADTAEGTGATTGTDAARSLLPWEGRAGHRLGQVLHALRLHGADNITDRQAWPGLLAGLLDDVVLYPEGPAHPRLAILGTVEARFQHAELMILGGMNEGMMPPLPPADPWMSQQMRHDLGLPPASWRTGLAAHDMAMALAKPEVLMTRAKKIDGAPTEPSRWLRRLEAVLSVSGVSLDRGRRLLGLANRLALPSLDLVPIDPPAPKVPASVRLKKLSATDLDLLIRDPYAYYARKILRLKPLGMIDPPPDAAMLGSLIHDALRDYVRHRQPGMTRAENLDLLLHHGRCCFRPLEQNPARFHGAMLFWWPRFLRIADWVAEHDAAAATALLSSLVEEEGAIQLVGNSGDWTITARADRIDRYQDGSIVIIDYKTGTPPTRKAVNEGRRVQLLTEALIAGRGGYQDITAGADIRALQYWALNGRGDTPGEIKDVTPDAAAGKAGGVAAVAEDGITRLIRRYDDDLATYPAVPISSEANRWSDYDHLARIAEWRGGGAMTKR